MVLNIMNLITTIPRSLKSMSDEPLSFTIPIAEFRQSGKGNAILRVSSDGNLDLIASLDGEILTMEMTSVLNQSLASKLGVNFPTSADPA